jgi:hypothetical protein
MCTPGQLSPHPTQDKREVIYLPYLSLYHTVVFTSVFTTVPYSHCRFEAGWLWAVPSTLERSLRTWPQLLAAPSLQLWAVKVYTAPPSFCSTQYCTHCCTQQCNTQPCSTAAWSHFGALQGDGDAGNEDMCAIRLPAILTSLSTQWINIADFNSQNRSDCPY